MLTAAIAIAALAVGLIAGFFLGCEAVRRETNKLIDAGEFDGPRPRG